MCDGNVDAEISGPAKEKRLATWGSETQEDLVLDHKKLEEALKKV